MGAINMRIGELAKASDVTIETIRYSEHAGLLPPPQRSSGGYRIYQSDAAKRLRFFRRNKTLGFSLEEIRQLLMLTDTDGPASMVKTMTQNKLDLIESKLAELQAMRNALRALVESCDGSAFIHHCPIIATLNRDHLYTQ